MITYVVAVFATADQWAVVKVNSSGPSYTVVAVCTSESDATAIAAALN